MKVIRMLTICSQIFPFEELVVHSHRFGESGRSWAKSYTHCIQITIPIIFCKIYFIDALSYSTSQRINLLLFALTLRTAERKQFVKSLIVSVVFVLRMKLNINFRFIIRDQLLPSRETSYAPHYHFASPDVIHLWISWNRPDYNRIAENYRKNWLHSRSLCL